MKNHEWKSFVSYKEAIERVHCHSIAPTISSWIWPQSNCKKREIIWTFFYSRSLTWHIDLSAREISKEGLLNLSFESIFMVWEKFAQNVSLAMIRAIGKVLIKPFQVGLETRIRKLRFFHERISYNSLKVHFYSAVYCIRIEKYKTVFLKIHLNESPVAITRI